MAHSIKQPHLKKNRTELAQDLRTYDLTYTEAANILLSALNQAGKMINKATNALVDVMDDKKTKWDDNFNADPMLKRWFGEAKNKGDVKDVYNRMESIGKRIGKGITIRFRPNKDKQDNTNTKTLAQNYGSLFDPKTFKVFAYMLSKDRNEIAAIFIHELMHTWFTDQKLYGETVYGSSLARKLAKENPRKARKSAENYEHYVLDLWS